MAQNTEETMPRVLTWFVMDLCDLVTGLEIRSVDGKLTIPEVELMVKVLHKLVNDMSDYEKGACVGSILDLLQRMFTLEYKRRPNKSAMHKLYDNMQDVKAVLANIK